MALIEESFYINLTFTVNICVPVWLVLNDGMVEHRVLVS